MGRKGQMGEEGEKGTQGIKGEVGAVGMKGNTGAPGSNAMVCTALNTAYNNGLPNKFTAIFQVVDTFDELPANATNGQLGFVVSDQKLHVYFGPRGWINVNQNCTGDVS